LESCRKQVKALILNGVNQPLSRFVRAGLYPAGIGPESRGTDSTVTMLNASDLSDAVEGSNASFTVSIVENCRI
jgi:hypothetical protein